MKPNTTGSNHALNGGWDSTHKSCKKPTTLSITWLYVVVHTCNLSTWEADLCELNVRLAYLVNARLAKATQCEKPYQNKHN